jgi:Thermolysin metallopeptidase, alpha-helical domain/Thermolysin metallopeptidase, catalytic domain
MSSGFIPPYLLRRVAAADRGRESAACKRTLDIDEQMRSRRARADGSIPPRQATGRRAWIIHHAGNTEQLPGEVARAEGDPVTGDAAVDEAYHWSDQTILLYQRFFGRRSLDDRGTTLSATVHYGRDYDNAFWDGTQLVFGDGDRRIFDRFTRPVDVFAHEFTHGVTQYSGGLNYFGQSGALNESMSDVFGSMVKQYVLDQTAQNADWLIGEGIFLPGVRGRALRSMLQPGTAYDDPVLGKDPQVSSMADYLHTDEDNGGVHINSGIPNRAFAWLATRLGGRSWDRAGQIWYATLTSSEVHSGTDFAGFARATVGTADRLYADDPLVAEQVRQAWRTVGVLDGPADAVAGEQSTAANAGLSGQFVSVRRTGGFAGVSRTYQLDLSTEREGSELRRLLADVERQRGAGDAPSTPGGGEPDRFVYSIVYGDRRLMVGEVDLTPELTTLIQTVLARGEEIAR